MTSMTKPEIDIARGFRLGVDEWFAADRKTRRTLVRKARERYWDVREGMGLSRGAGDMFTKPDAQPKTGKSERYTLILMMLPASEAGVGNLCPPSTTGCRTDCLNWSGHGEMPASVTSSYRSPSSGRPSTPRTPTPNALPHGRAFASKEHQVTERTEELALVDEVDRAMHSGLSAYTAYAAWGDDERVTLNVFTNDNLDTGYPSEYAEWVLDFFRRGEMTALDQVRRHTGRTRWTPGGVVSVYINGEAYLDA